MATDSKEAALLYFVNDALAWPSENSSDESSSEDSDCLSVELLHSSSEEGSSDVSLSSSDAEDDEENIFLFSMYQFLIHGKRRTHVEHFLATVHSYSDAEFKEHFRLNRESAYSLVDALNVSGFLPTHAEGAPKITAELSFLMLLWCLGNTEPYRTMADRFDMSISSVFRVVRRVVHWILSIQENIIKWPEGQEIVRISQGFEKKRGISGCIGAIDCSHIAIKQPSVDQADYSNRKKYFSIILQGVVDADGKFTNVYCGEPGSLHDARVLRRSDLAQAAEEYRDILFPNNTFIIGDSAYPSLRWLVPPFRDNGHLSPEQAEFNFIHSSTRMPVERCFGMLKGRFRRLKLMEFLDIEFIPKVVVACCVLHNICLAKYDQPDVDVEANVEVLGIEGGQGNDFAENQDRRAELFNSLFRY